MTKLKQSNSKLGRCREYARLEFVRKHRGAKLGGRFRGSQISKAWTNNLKFNPKIDLWYITPEGMRFEQFKSAQQGRKPYIGKAEIAQVQQFADLFRNYNFVWVGYVLKESHKQAVEIRLN